MFKVERIKNDSQENVKIDKSCFDAYKLVFDTAVENYTSSSKGPFIKIDITNEFADKKDLTDWNFSLAQLYKQLYSKLEAYMTDYITSIKPSSLGWTYHFSHLLNARGIEAMQDLLGEMSSELESEANQSLSL